MRSSNIQPRLIKGGAQQQEPEKAAQVDGLLSFEQSVKEAVQSRATLKQLSDPRKQFAALFN
jgi:hypothetical protein